jgi:hypothetical protein
MWHGSSQRFDTFGAGHGDERALFGLGVYTTDDMSVAVGYSQKRPIGAATQIVARSDTPAGRALDEAVAGGAEREGYVYNVVWRGENPPRVLDLEATMPDEVRGIARSIVDSLDDSVLTAEVPLDDWEELVSIVGDPASTFEDFYRKLVRVFTESGQPSTEFIDILQEMSDDLVEAGVDAFRYTGGKRVGKGHLHEAMVWLDSESVEVVQAGNIEGLFRGPTAGGVARETGEAVADLSPDDFWKHMDENVVQAQRGAPESVVTHWNTTSPGWGMYFSGGGAEYIGDLLGRMAQRGGPKDIITSKLGQIYNTLGSQYNPGKNVGAWPPGKGFRNELADVAKQVVRDGLYPDEQAAYAAIRRDGQRYADAFKEIEVFNDAQLHAREAAIAFGEFDFRKALDEIDALSTLVEDATSAEWNAIRGIEGARAFAGDPRFAG